ncbi:MAG: 16S rRNA (cytidine(1402)-2'-O)-methyltransferase [Paramuribaculum sp.]|nr:16S rRNA (cytidine(1402)-2'-O)-methyltransferase [Paramuribaculum sp.]
MSGILYMVPTPVGNMNDMTPRAIEVLKSCSTILAEDTRTSSVLMKHFGISTPLMAHHMHNEHSTVSGIADRIEGGENIALITDAGTPGISDPGFLLSRECRSRGIEVITLPGPTAFVPALVDSGLPCDRFLFEGFLPQKKGRSTRIAELAELPYTIIIYESPLRLIKTLAQLAESFGSDRRASVSREISKIHETTVRGTLSELENYFSQNNPKGEIVIIVEGKQQETVRIHKNKYKDNEKD